jgi:RimJ/RimL family protein N-acetyltransferase
MFARTERLLLRPGWIEDAPMLAETIADEAIVRNLARVPWPYSLAHAEAWLQQEPSLHAPSCLVFRRTHGAPQLIGGVGLGRDPDGEVELGYWIARPYWGLGFATEAARPLVDFARHSLRLKRLTAGHFLDNPASGRVLEKLGFRPTGTIASRYSAGRGKAVPSRIFALRLDEDEAAVEEQPADAACRMLAA